MFSILDFSLSTFFYQFYLSNVFNGFLLPKFITNLWSVYFKTRKLTDLGDLGDFH
jgi:hypothetical protein